MQTVSDIVNRLEQGRLWSFPGGVHPPERKRLSNQTPIARYPLAHTLYISLKQHVGVEGRLLVKEGDYVLKGQPLSKSTNPFAVPVHAPTSGTISRIGPHISAHPSALDETTVTLLTDGQEQWLELKPVTDYQQQPKIQLLEKICRAGISGMGGAGFPTHIKAAPKKDLEFLIVNGVECEPYISADDRLMQEHAKQIVQGIEILEYILSPKHILIAVEDNKPKALAAMQQAAKALSSSLVIPVKTKYPSGGEKQLIQILTGREVPQQGLPIDVGVIMQNVGTCFAIADAILRGKPLIERVVTLTGEALQHPGNAWVPLGTPIAHLLQQAGYQANKQTQSCVVMGGPMMGFTAGSTQVPVIKTSNCLLVPAKRELSLDAQPQSCIRCGVCADACPAGLLPQQLYWYARAGEFDKLQDHHLFDCIECGACAFVCPSKIPLVHDYRKAKAEIRAAEEEKEKADKARERFEARKTRLLREQQERDEKHRQAAEARKAKMTQGDAKDKVAAALARAKAKKTQSVEQQVETPATQQATTKPNNQDKVAAAIARAKAKKDRLQAEQAETAQPQVESANEPTATSKQDKVAAAIARAKAKKARLQAEQAETAQPQIENANEPTATSKQDKVAAAIARAKAKKARLQAEQAETAQPQVEPADEPTATSKQDKVAAAIARAKAKKAQRQAQAAPQPDASTEKNEDQENSTSVEAQQPVADQQDADKAARIAAAVAKAKARRAAKTTQPPPEDQ